MLAQRIIRKCALGPLQPKVFPKKVPKLLLLGSRPLTLLTEWQMVTMRISMEVLLATMMIQPVLKSFQPAILEILLYCRLGLLLINSTIYILSMVIGAAFLFIRTRSTLILALRRIRQSLLLPMYSKKSHLALTMQLIVVSWSLRGIIFGSVTILRVQKILPLVFGLQIFIFPVGQKLLMRPLFFHQIMRFRL